MGKFPPTNSIGNNNEVGPKMDAAVRIVEAHGPKSSKNALAKVVGPNGSQRFGYGIVDRAISAGLLALERGHPAKTPQAIGAVVLTDRGEWYVEEFDKPSH